MLKDAISYLNLKLESLGYFNEVICLCERIEREGRVYPAQYTSAGEYKAINLDSSGSVCYWRKNGDVTISEDDNSDKIGIQYKTKVPLKFIGFIRKEIDKDDQYFSDNLIAGIIGNLTLNNSALKSALKAKTVRISATKYVTDGRQVGKDEYEKIDFEPNYSHAYFSIDFEVVIVTATQCYTDICGDTPIDPLTRYNFCSDSIFNRLSVSQKACLINKLCGLYEELTIISGSIDGLNTVFVLSAPPVQVFKNGQLLTESVDYSVSGNTVTYFVTPLAGAFPDIISHFGNN